MSDRIKDLLDDFGACAAARAWIEESAPSDWETALAQCPYGDWIIWFVCEMWDRWTVDRPDEIRRLTVRAFLPLFEAELVNGGFGDEGDALRAYLFEVRRWTQGEISVAALSAATANLAGLHTHFAEALGKVIFGLAFNDMCFTDVEAVALNHYDLGGIDRIAEMIRAEMSTWLPDMVRRFEAQRTTEAGEE